MVVKKYENAQTLLAEYETTMLEHEAISQLILYNAYQHLDVTTNNMNEVLFGTVLQEEEAILLFCNIAPHSLALYVVNSNHEKSIIGEAAIALAEDLIDNHIPLTGINGRHDVCHSFIEYYKTRIKCTFQEKMVAEIMEIRSINDIKPVEGGHRLANIDEAKLITDWMIQFAIDSFENEMDYEAVLKKAAKLITESKVFIYEDINQKAVSMAIMARQLSHGIAISYVFTPKEYRGMGYAAANVHFISKSCLDNGYEFCSLFVDKKNPITNRAYEKVGYHILEDNYEYKILLQNTIL